ncbi:mutanobactin A biosynthesis transcriptional regulator MubR [Lactovum odontotermitis]
MKKYNKNDLRIFDAFCIVAGKNENYNEITLSKVTAAMGFTGQVLNRTRYRNVDDIVTALRDYESQEAFEKMESFIASGRKDLSTFLTDEFFPILYKNRKYLHVLYGKNSNPVWMALLIKKYTQLLSPHFSDAAKAFDLEPVFVTKRVVCTVISSLSDWLSASEPESPEIFGKNFSALLKHSFIELAES